MALMSRYNVHSTNTDLIILKIARLKTHENPTWNLQRISFWQMNITLETASLGFPLTFFGGPWHPLIHLMLHRVLRGSCIRCQVSLDLMLIVGVDKMAMIEYHKMQFNIFQQRTQLRKNTINELMIFEEALIVFMLLLPEQLPSKRLVSWVSHVCLTGQV